MSELFYDLNIFCFIKNVTYTPKQFFIKVCESANQYCQEAVKSVKVVSSCPTSKEKWDKAAIEKNCTNDAAQQNCTSANLFLYHCLINGYGNETLEVCAPQRVIFGKI